MPKQNKTRQIKKISINEQYAFIEDLLKEQSIRKNFQY